MRKRSANVQRCELWAKTCIDPQNVSKAKEALYASVGDWISDAYLKARGAIGTYGALIKL